MVNSEKKQPRDKPEIDINLGLGNIFKGIGNFVDLIGRMSEKGEKFAEKTKEFRGKGPLKDLKGVYGFSVKMGLGGEPEVEQFGNVKTTTRGPTVEETREPIVDVFDEKDEIRIIAEMPGIEEKDIRINVKGDILILMAEGPIRKYQKEILLPTSVEPMPIYRSHKNGLFEVKFKKG